MLFLGVPTGAQRAAAARALGGELQAVGIAGASRSMAPAAMEAELARAGAFLASLGAPVLHYKVCSTFDSAPGVGSIGVAVRTLRRFVANPFVPVVGGQPGLGRYCAFSNLFAAAGRGGVVERIDRHPTMRQHPVTPMGEADLRRHLALQGLEPVAALHYPLYAQAQQEQDAALAQALATRPAAVLLDVADDTHLASVGRLVWESACRESLLAVGASSVAQALLAHWRHAGEADAEAGTRSLAAASGPVLVFAGSLSPVTARQVEAARSFALVRIAPEELQDHARATAIATAIIDKLRRGRPVLVCTAPAGGRAAETSAPAAIAQLGARFVRRLVLECAQGGVPLRRLGIAGGDTSSHAVQALAPWGLSYGASLGAGVAVSRMHCDDPHLDGMELMLKGGQMGAEDVFEQLLRGTHGA
jgi:uncharacterized protein YgbK (DUF1537 family)